MTCFQKPHRVIESIVVTDVALMREGLVGALNRHASMRVVGAAATPHEAATVASRQRPAVALLDMSMASRLEIVSELRQVSPPPCVVSFSVEDHDDDLLACVELGVAGFVPKHGTIDDLVAACESALRGDAYCPPQIAARLFRQVASLAECSRPMPLLSTRETEIVELIDRGLPNKAIARHLSIGLATVKNHVHNILQKLHVTTRREAVVAALRKTPAARNTD